MNLKMFRLMLGGLLAAIGVFLIARAGMMLSAGGLTPRQMMLPVGMIVGSLAVCGAYYYAMFRPVSMFQGFRALVGAAVLLVALYYLGSGAVGINEALSAETFNAADMVLPLVRIIGAVVVGLLYYFAMFAPTRARRTFENILSIPELVKKLAFTLGLLCIYRIGFQIPLPGLNQEALTEAMGQASGGPLGVAMEYFSMFTGGNLQKMTLFGLGIMPYISASIIFQLLIAVVPALEKLQKEGPAGYKKIQEYTRYATVGLCIIQAVGIWTAYLSKYLYPQYTGGGTVGMFLMCVTGLTAGTVFLMWLGEQIDEYGIGNGISLIIMAGIVSRLPVAIRELISRASPTIAGGSGGRDINLIEIIFLAASFVFVVAGSILITQAQRRIPIQQAKQTRGRKVYGGQRMYLPLRVNHGGVMPIIFASSLLLFPNAIIGYMGQWFKLGWAGRAADLFLPGSVVYTLVYVGLIFFFAYFWTTVQFRPKDMADQLRDQGHFIPGLRPGKRTADYLEKVMERITYCGAGFLAAIAVIPSLLAGYMGIPWQIAAFLGGTGLLIMVSVALDLVQRIESNLVMRNYGGLLGEGGGRIRGPRG
jgi:preprotein translocase subunit SecY